ncbi:MAG: cupin domain-containing protein [Pseudomonadota bacterium]
MNASSFIKNIPIGEPQELVDLIDYQESRVVSRTFAQNSVMSMTLFAFDEGEGLSAHTAGGDAFVQVLDGRAAITIGEEEIDVSAGQVLVMPANVPHAVNARIRFKMLLVVVKG